MPAQLFPALDVCGMFLEDIYGGVLRCCIHVVPTASQQRHSGGALCFGLRWQLYVSLISFVRSMLQMI